MIKHPYIRYAQALIIHKYHLKSPAEIKLEFIISEIDKGLNTFSVKPSDLYDGKETVKFNFVRMRNNAPQFIFLSPNAITSEKNARYLWKAAEDYINKYVKSKEDVCNKSIEIGMSDVPLSGEFLVFSENGNISRGYAKSNIVEQGLGLVTTLTKDKPCLQYISGSNNNIIIENVCIIPDLSVQDMVDFIFVFERMKEQELSDDIMYGKVEKKGKKKTIFKPIRPKIFRGNFPNAPLSSSLGSIALLGAIGEFAKNTNSPLAMRVLEQLKDIPIYMIKYGNASIFSYNHYIVDLARTGYLRRIIDSMFYIRIYKEGVRESGNIEYQKLDMFSSRFLQLFSRPAFKDFMSIRAEYPRDLLVLFKVYFEKMEKIEPRIVTSAKSLGQWLNLIAYKVAQTEKNNSEDDLNSLKSKILVELESTIFSAKSGDALIAQVMVRAGRLYNLDAPTEAACYMEETSSGNLALDKAKNLLVSFMRLKSYKEKSNSSTNEDSKIEKNSNEKTNISSSEGNGTGDFFEED